MQDQVREKLITDHLPLVRRVSERLHASWGDSGLEIGDFVACGAIGLVQAADRFDPTRGVSFKTFAEVVIEGAIRDGVGRCRNWFGRRAAGAIAWSISTIWPPTAGRSWLGQSHEGVGSSRALWNGRPFSNRQATAISTFAPCLADGIQHLPERERRVVRLCFYEGKKLTRRRQGDGVQLPRASRLRKQALRRLRHAIDKGRKRLPESAVGRGLAP